MAAVLDALAPYVTKLITDMAEEEVSKLLGVSNEINKLGDKVESMEAYVADAERRRINDAMVQRWVSKLKGALYEATDILELCQLDAEERRQMQAQGGCMATMETKAPGCLLPFLFCLRKPGFAHAMGGRIKDLNTRLDGISQEMAGLHLQALTPSPVQTPPSEATPPSRTTTSLFDEAAIVGDAIEMGTKALVQELLLAKDRQAMTVVSITAAGGMGKTTLARKIFNNSDIQGEFNTRIWLSVTESYSPAKLLSSAITQATGGDNPHAHGGDQQVLTQTLVAALSATAVGKFLLVLDDVWSNRPWNDILQSPVIEAGRRQPGSRVIITTRKEDLVKDMGAAYHQHHVKPLSNEDAWSLLKKQLLMQDVRNESALDHLKHIGTEIIRNCDGLPLAIKAIGGLLRTKGTTEHEWRGVLQDPAWRMDKTHEDLNIALRLSYEDLPPQLKQCFLYLTLFPKEFFMDKHSTTGMWMSQGFIRVPAGESGPKELEDIGMDYFRDLIRRNLIEPHELVKDGSICQMHDVVRSFGQYIAKEEALSVVGPGQLSSLVSSPKLRHLSISSAELESESGVLPKWSSVAEKQDMLRSLIIFGRMSFEPGSYDSSLSRFASLRALLVDHAECDWFLESLGKLKHLRFLALCFTDISRLPDNIGKLKLLENINLLNCPSFDGKIPHGVLKLERLRYLVIGNDTKFSVPKGLGALTNLRTLCIFPAQMDGEWCSLQELGPLCQLRMLSIACLEEVPSGLLAAKAKICEKKQLRNLVLLCYKFVQLPITSTDDDVIKEMSQEKCQQMEEVVDQLCPPPPLETLLIWNYIGRRPPRWMCVTASADFNSLVVLDMAGLPFCTQLPDGLCRLPSLETLMIDYALAISRVGPEFQRHTETAASRRLERTTPSFPSLQFLRFKVLPQWEEWEWEEDAEAEDIIDMPSLQTLYIGECKLPRLPPGLASSRRLALREIFLYDSAVITALDNFPSVVRLEVYRCPSLKIIRGFPRMQVVCIESCPALEVLEAGPALDIMELKDPDMETLPEYLRCLKPRSLRLDASRLKLHNMLLLSSCDEYSSADEYQAEMDKVEHCGKVLLVV